MPDWRSYLISPGEAAILGNFASQLVDPMWGSPSWSSKTAVPVRRPFLDKSILLIASQHSKHDALRSLVAACVHAMGASVFKTDYALDISRFADFDYIVVEDRDKNLKPSVTMERTGKLCNILWLKQCLVRPFIQRKNRSLMDRLLDAHCRPLRLTTSDEPNDSHDLTTHHKAGFRLPGQDCYRRPGLISLGHAQIYISPHMRT